MAETSVRVEMFPGAIQRSFLPTALSLRFMAAKAERAANRARVLAPGSMKMHVHSRVMVIASRPVGVVECDHPAVQYVLHGTRPHMIRARRASVLVFMVGGRKTFAKSVRHPGTRPNDFLGKAIRGFSA